jgi:excisionase family DNA binding protein
MNQNSCQNRPQEVVKMNAPEWLRVSEAKRLFGISKPKLYQLIHAGTIRSAALRSPQQVRGTRLISSMSLRTYIEALADAQAKEVRP